MEYILTEKEYKDLLKFKESIEIESIKELQDLCTKIANEMPIKVDWKDEIEPWGCILTTKGERYCDECPVQKICPYEYKNWSQ